MGSGRSHSSRHAARGSVLLGCLSPRYLFQNSEKAAGQGSSPASESLRLLGWTSRRPDVEGWELQRPVPLTCVSPHGLFYTIPSAPTPLPRGSPLPSPTQATVASAILREVGPLGLFHRLENHEDGRPTDLLATFFFFLIKCMTVLGLHCFALAFCSCGEHPLLPCWRYTGCLLQGLLSLQSTGLERAGLAVEAHGLSCMWDLPGPGIKPVSLCWQKDSYPLYHQGSPFSTPFKGALGQERAFQGRQPHSGSPWPGSCSWPSAPVIYQVHFFRLACFFNLKWELCSSPIKSVLFFPIHI